MLSAGPLPQPAGGVPLPELPAGRTHAENAAQGKRKASGSPGLPRMTHSSRTSKTIPGRFTPPGSLHWQQGARLRGARPAGAVHPGPPLAARHCHRHAEAQVPAKRGPAAGVAEGFSEDHRWHQATPNGSPLQAHTLGRDGPGGRVLVAGHVQRGGSGWISGHLHTEEANCSAPASLSGAALVLSRQNLWL